MATVDVAMPKPKLSERDTVSAKILRFLMKAPVNLLLIFLGLLWLVPTLGLFLTSILPAQAFTVKGWWQIFSKPSVATWSNYDAVLHNHAITHSLLITLAPGSSQNAASVIALAMWRTSFGGINDFGVGSAIAVFLFVLVVPVLP